MFKLKQLAPMLGLLSAALFTAPNAASANPNLTPGVWTKITPPAAQINTGGPNYFTQGLAIDPSNLSTLYFCVCGYDQNFSALPGSIWKTTDGGSNWTSFTQLDQPIHVRVDPANPNHMYAVDGVRGNTLGFWVTTNGGATWTQPAAWTTMCNNLSNNGEAGFNDSYALDIEPGNANHVLVSAHGGAPVVGESTDGGTTWTSHVTPATYGSGGFSVFFLYSPNHSVGNSQSWLFCTQGNGMWRTTNSGASWTQVTTTNMNHGGNQIYYTSGGNVIAGAVGGPIRSTDNGATWQASTGAVGGSMGLTGDGTNLYTGCWWQTQPFLTSAETNGLTWTGYSGSPTFTNAGPMEMVSDKVNGIVYSSNTSNGLTQAANSGDGIWALKVSAAGPPAAPIGLTATAGNTQVALAWNVSGGATAYDVKRSTVSGSGYAAVSSPTVTNYTNTGLTNGTTYYFVVDAKNATGTSGNSNQASATPTSSSSITADDTSGSITYTGTWNPNNISGYYLNTLHASLTANDFASFTFTGTSIQWIGAKNTDHGIANVYIDGVLNTTVDGYSSSWIFQQVMCNITGLSNASHTIKILVTGTKNASSTNYFQDIDAFIYGTASGGAPAAPTGLTATPGNAQVALSWTASTGATAYDVKRSTVSGSGYATVSSPTTTSYTNTGLTNGTTYYFVVDAKNASGTGGNSSQVSATPNASVEVDDGAASVVYTGTWNPNNISGYYLTTLHASLTPNDFVTFTFTGTSIQWIGAKNNDHGKANVYIDNVLQTTVDGYASSWLFQQVMYSKSGLTSGSHAIKIVVTGNKNPSSANLFQDIDAFIYTP